MKVSLAHYDLWMGSARGRLDASLAQASVSRDTSGTPLRGVGKSCVVYRMQMPDRRKLALRMFFDVETPGSEGAARLNEHGQAVEKHLQSWSEADSPFVHYQFLKDGLQLPSGDRIPVIAMSWIEGEPLDKWLHARAAKGDRAALKGMLDRWLRLLATLTKAEVNHGQLVPWHVLVEQGGVLRLIDYDALCVPQLLGQISPRSFPAGWLQHPGQTPLNDTYPGVYLAAFMALLAADPQLGESGLFGPAGAREAPTSPLIVAKTSGHGYALAPYCEPWLSRGDAVLSNLLTRLVDLANQPISSLPPLATVLSGLDDRKTEPRAPKPGTTIPPPPPPGPGRTAVFTIKPPPPPHPVRSRAIQPPVESHETRPGSILEKQVESVVSQAIKERPDDFIFTVNGGVQPGRPGDAPAAEPKPDQLKATNVELIDRPIPRQATEPHPAMIREPEIWDEPVRQHIFSEMDPPPAAHKLATMRALARGDRAAFLRDFNAAELREAHTTLSPDERRALALAIRDWLSDAAAVGLREQMPCSLDFPDGDRFLARWKGPDKRFADRVVLGISRKAPAGGQRPEECGLVFSSIVVHDDTRYRLAPYSAEIKPEFHGCTVAVWAVIDVGFADEANGAEHFLSGPLCLGGLPHQAAVGGLLKSIRNRLLK